MDAVLHSGIDRLKGVPIKDLIYSRIDAFTGAIIVNVVAFFIVVMCAATIFTNGVQVNSVADVSAALLPLAGQYAGILFAFGLLNASLFAAEHFAAFNGVRRQRRPRSRSWRFKEFQRSAGISRPLRRDYRDKRARYYASKRTIAPDTFRFSSPQWDSSAHYPDIHMLVIINDKRVMGDHVNSKIYNFVTWTTVVIM